MTVILDSITSFMDFLETRPTAELRRRVELADRLGRPGMARLISQVLAGRRVGGHSRRT